MIIYIKVHDFHYEMERLCRLFFPNDKLIIFKEKEDYDTEKNYIFTQRIKIENIENLQIKIKLENKLYEKQSEINNNIDDPEKELSSILFKVLVNITETRPPWGILTGVRPIKLFRNVVKEKGFFEAKNHFINKFLVLEDKLNLTIQTMKEEEKILKLSKKNSFSLYISIPFCPSRCSYCSFVSQSVEQARKLIPEYILKLCTEIQYTSKIANKLNLRLETVYIGGGTPTILSSDQLKSIIIEIKKNFDMQFLREFTVEAGRPDTITREKLLTLMELGVERISINPQTLNNVILKNIGRKHSAEETIDAFNIAKEIGFLNINMDLIAGLPGDTLESFEKSLMGICALDAQSITIHALCMKKASTITEQGKILEKKEGIEAVKMMRFSEKILLDHGYLPYYLYRQSRIVGNLENVGWSKPSRQGFYNVYVMDETHTILSCGASAVTKVKDPKTLKIERIANYKFPYEYIGDFEEIIKRKNKVVNFYEKL